MQKILVLSISLIKGLMLFKRIPLLYFSVYFYIILLQFKMNSKRELLFLYEKVLSVFLFSVFHNTLRVNTCNI